MTDLGNLVEQVSDDMMEITGIKDVCRKCGKQFLKASESRKHFEDVHMNDIATETGETRKIELTKPEPSRLEIAAMVLTSLAGNSEIIKEFHEQGVLDRLMSANVEMSLVYAEALITANREMK